MTEKKIEKGLRGSIYFQSYNTPHIALSRNKLKEVENLVCGCLLCSMNTPPAPLPAPLSLPLSSSSVWTPALPQTSSPGALRLLFPFPDLPVSCGQPSLSLASTATSFPARPCTSTPRSPHPGYSPSSLLTHFPCNFNRECFITFIYRGGAFLPGCVWKSEANLRESGLSFYHVDPGI